MKLKSIIEVNVHVGLHGGGGGDDEGFSTTRATNDGL